MRPVPSLFEVVEGCFGEGADESRSVDRLPDEFCLPEGADFVRLAAVSNACAFINAEPPDGATDIPVRRLVTFDEFEGQGNDPIRAK